MAYLVLEDGTVFTGKLFGSGEIAAGEVVFNTSMAGYQEILTDPSSAGQLVCMTYPLIGNYGWNEKDMESASIIAKGLIVSSLCERPSNWLAKGDLNSFLKERGVTGITDVDTRALTKHLRAFGEMKGIICNQMPTDEQIKNLKAFKTENQLQAFSCKESYIVGQGRRTIAVLDLGARQSLIAKLVAMGNCVKVYTAHASAEEILNSGCDGVVISNGPGNPKDYGDITKTVGALMSKKPVFGICLGHSIMALSQGGDTEKMPYGHRGANHPVKDLQQNKVLITAQNHSYTVVNSSVSAFADVSHINVNDNTVEGLVYKNGPSASVQFYPVAEPGEKDSLGLLDNFLQLVDSNQ